MIVALIDNGSLAPAAHRQLRTLAGALSVRTGIQVHAVSWKHSDRIPAAALDGNPAWTLRSFVKAMTALGQRDFIFVPYFLSPQGAIGSALRSELDSLRAGLPPAPGSPAGEGFEFAFTAGLAERGILPSIVADRIREALAATRLVAPPVVLVDHGGPSAASAALRDDLARHVRRTLGSAIGPLAASSMEGDHPPLLADVLTAEPCSGRATIVAPLFLSPGRHAGPGGDIAQICTEAATAAGTRCHLADLVGSHPAVVATLAAALHETLSNLHAHPIA